MLGLSLLLQALLTPSALGSAPRLRVVYIDTPRNAAQQQTLDTWSDRFKSETGLEVEFVHSQLSLTDQLVDNIRSKLKDGTADVVAVDCVYPGMFSDLLAPLESANIAPSSLGDLLPTVQAGYQQADGQHLAAAWFSDFGLLYYRTDLLEKYGFSAPGPQGWTYDELEHIAATVQQGERAEGQPSFDGFVWMGKAYEGLTCFALEVVAGHGGGQLLDKGGRVTVNNTGFRQALRRMVRWVYGGAGSVGAISPLAVLGYIEPDVVRRFCQERTAMFARNWPYMIGQCNAAGMVGRFGVVRNAGVTRGGGRGSQGGWAFGVNARSEHLAEAVKFVELAVSKQQQLDYRYGYNGLPTRTDLASNHSLCANQAANFCLRSWADVVNGSLQQFFRQGSTTQMIVLPVSSGICPPVHHQATVCDVDVADYVVARPAIAARDRYAEVSRVFWTTVNSALRNGAVDVEEYVYMAECDLLKAMGSWGGPSSCHRRWAAVCPPGSFFSIKNASGGGGAATAPAPGDRSGLQFCLPCQSGTYAEDSGQTECQECPRGTFSDIGATDCASCPPGFQAPSPGMRLCRACEVGTYSDQEGSETCVSCPAPMTTKGQFSTSEAQCGCFDRPLLRRSSANSTAWCEPCPEGLLCPGGREAPRQAEGFMAGLPAFDGALPPYVVRCDPRKCPAGLPLGACPQNREGLGCNLCIVDFVTDMGNNCVSCEPHNNTSAVVFTVVFLILVVLCLVALTRTKVMLQRTEVVTILVCCGLTVNTIQSLTVFSQLSLNWVEPIQSLKRVLDIVAFRIEFLNPECVLRSNSPVVAFALSLLVYPVFACLLVVATLGWKLCGGKVKFNQLLNMQGFVLTVVYLSVALTSVNPLRCEQNPDLTFSMVENRDVLCWTSSAHRGLILLSVCGILVYMVGFLALVTWGTFSYPRRISRPDAVDFLTRYAFLFARLREPCYFYCLIYVLRNMTIAIIPVAFAQNPSLQVSGMTFAILVVGLVQCRLFPWRTQGSNLLDVCFTVVLILISSLGALLVQVPRAEAEVVVQRMLLAAVFSLFGLVLAIVLVNVGLRFFGRRRFSVFLSHHKEGAGVLARFFKLGLAGLVSQEIFLDSDNLRHLDHIATTIAFDTQNLFVLLTRLTLTRPWCAVEIATAVKHKLNIVLVACDDFDSITDEFIEQVPSLWSPQQWTAMSRVGVSVEDVQEAYRRLQVLGMLKFSFRMTELEQQAIVEAALNLCEHGDMRMSWRSSWVCLRIGRASLRCEPQSERRVSIHQGADVLLLGDGDQAEAVSTAYVLRRMLQAKTRLRVSVVPDNREEAKAVLATASFLILVLTPGALERPRVAGRLTEALELGHLEVVPLLACSSFTFPDADFLDRMRQGAFFDSTHPAIQPMSLDQLALAYETVFGALAARFSPHGSYQIQEAEVEELCHRLSVNSDGSPKARPLGLSKVCGLMSPSSSANAPPKHGQDSPATHAPGPEEAPNDATLLDFQNCPFDQNASNNVTGQDYPIVPTVRSGTVGTARFTDQNSPNCLISQNGPGGLPGQASLTGQTSPVSQNGPNAWSVPSESSQSPMQPWGQARNATLQGYLRAGQA